MIIKNLTLNNISDLNKDVDISSSLSIAGLSGSGKTSFCSAISEESLRRVITLLPKSEYSFLFSDLLDKNYRYDSIANVPLTFFLGKPSVSSNPRSTVGTHTGIFSYIRKVFSDKYHIGKEFFSFNNSALWCPKCKGRGSTAGKECTHCHGSRYSPDVAKYPLTKNGTPISDINQFNFFQLRDLQTHLDFPKQYRNLIETIINLKIGYLDLNRTVSTLSGGERLRLLLAEFLISCENCLLILDEVSSGVDFDTLQTILDEVRKLGSSNQIWLIDHSDVVLKATNDILYFGPGSGNEGGKIVDESPRPLPQNQPIITIDPKDFYEIKKIKKRTINIDSLAIPKNRLTVITGESGCGKSTLVNDCLPAAFKKQFKNASYVVIGQSRNQSVTSKSTISTFLDIKKSLLKYNITNSSIDEILSSKARFDSKSTNRIQLLHDLGVGYLTANRTIQSLSSGEFQCVHMVSCLFEDNKNDVILAFDEPSAGLSQNILNNFLYTIRKILSETNTTILMIEHNDYLIKNADFLIDFGKRKDAVISHLEVKKNVGLNLSSQKYEDIITSRIDGKINEKKGYNQINLDNDLFYQSAENQFKGGVLKQISPTARWIYKDFETEFIKPIITIDFEKSLYSKNTFLFEISNYINNIAQVNFHSNILSFDLFNKNNQCDCCKGKSHIRIFDIDVVINDKSKGIWDGLFKAEIMNELKRYNFSKIKFLFKEIKKETKMIFDKPFSEMNREEKNAFLYGYWDKKFYDSQKQTNRTWKGIIFLIQKYIRDSKNQIKDDIKESIRSIVCPICLGSVIKTHDDYLIEHKDIRSILTESIEQNIDLLDKLILTKEISEIVGKDAKLNDDVSTYSREKQVSLKCLELKNANLFGFTIVLNNVNPFRNYISRYLDDIQKDNEIVICDYEGIKITKDEIFDKYFSSGKLKKLSYVYEIANYSKISTKLNKLKKEFPCPYCKGKGVIKQTSLFEGVDSTEILCTSCQSTGFSEDGLHCVVDNVPVSTWLYGKLSDLQAVKSDDSSLMNLSLMKKIKDLNKKELLSIVLYYNK